MFIASKLKKENICEYLLYMWQVEDLLRAFGLDMDAIDERIVSTYPAEPQERKRLHEWYESLVEMMRLENVQNKGHLQLNKNIIIELNEFHGLLMKSGKEPAYNAKFYHILPLLAQLRKQQNDLNLSDIEVSFNFQYGFMLLKMKKADITPQTAEAQIEISKFMVLLNRYYQLYKTGELSLEE